MPIQIETNKYARVVEVLHGLKSERAEQLKATHEMNLESLGKENRLPNAFSAAFSTVSTAIETAVNLVSNRHLSTKHDNEGPEVLEVFQGKLQKIFDALVNHAVSTLFRDLVSQKPIIYSELVREIKSGHHAHDARLFLEEELEVWTVGLKHLQVSGTLYLSEDGTLTEFSGKLEDLPEGTLTLPMLRRHLGLTD